jgi:hypothetical protein
MLEQIIGKLDAYLGRQFLLASFLPCLVFGALNLLLAYVGFADVRSVVDRAIAADTASHAAYLTMTLLGLAVIALMSRPLAPTIQRLLQGDWLPKGLARPLVMARARERDNLQKRLEIAQERRRLLLGASEVEQRLRAHRAAGATLKAIAAPTSIGAAERAIKELRVRRARNDVIDAAMFIDAVASLADALRRNCAEIPALEPPISPADLDLAQRLAALQIEMNDVLVPYVVDIAERDESRCQDERARRFADLELAPTELGNDVAGLRGYCETRYGLDFDLFWPRLMLIIQKDEKLAGTIISAKTQLDFWALSLALTLLTAIFWLFSLAIWGSGQSLWVVFWISFVGPPLARLILLLVHGSYAVFAESVRTAVDTKRFDLLDSLNFARPANVEAEKALWREIGYWMKLNGPPPARDFAAKAVSAS